MGQGHHSDRLGRMVGLGDGGAGTPHLWESVDRGPISVEYWPAQRSNEAMVVLAETLGHVWT